jgi:predicted nucleotide-binding protein with TIR-like domain
VAIAKIFIASSGRTLELAKQLREQVKSNHCKAELWTEVSQEATGKSILQMLKEATEEYDFAVIILARDDVITTKAGDALKARDNCVFEAGLFMGILGETRCFLVSSVEENDLPSDLRGIIYLPFSEPSNLDDPSACRAATATAATRIQTAVWKAQFKPLRNRRLSQAKLLERERSTNEGGDLLMDQVVVASGQPLDVGYAYAQQVRRNIDVGNIRYIYLFQGSPDGARKTCQLLQMVLLANILSSQSDADYWPGRLEKLRANAIGIKQDLERICKDERIKVYFLPEVPAMQYCIHNAGDDKHARMYVKSEEAFYEWEMGKGPYNFWVEARESKGALDPQPPKAVFYGVPGFKINQGPFFSTLKRAVEFHFPEKMGDEVMKLCLEGPALD